ncbi:LysR family transcriptional regulator [Flavivirga eckloniae]|uniref:LysR family transcriptional regulator n=1 Tax=Flavivirga eckloniae TaxID=1803846 RepID=A0A2K9PNH3_9FLAO|nr:LysR family transcriptional regulator [Flavivirga eckloniae]AUP78602.1 LysR family transcriptional regulator [Flavivirga eckloniae]
MNYTLHQLEIFSKVAELKSVTKASEALYLTQPAVSIQLKKFQEQFNMPLFEIVGRKLYITEFGDEIAQAAKRILDEVQAMNYKSKSYHGQLAGKLKIAIVSTAKYAMPYLLSDFIHQHKDVDLIMDVTNKATVVKSLENNEVDFAMVSTRPKNLSIERIELMKNKLFLVGGDEYTGKPHNIPRYGFERLPLIFREHGSATRLAMEQYIAKHELSVYKKMELTSNEAIKQAVIAGLGVSIMPLIGIKNSLNMFELQIIKAKGLPIETTWNLIWLKSKNLSLVAKAFINHIQENKEAIIKEHFGWLEDY